MGPWAIGKTAFLLRSDVGSDDEYDIMLTVLGKERADPAPLEICRAKSPFSRFFPLALFFGCVANDLVGTTSEVIMVEMSLSLLSRKSVLLLDGRI